MRRLVLASVVLCISLSILSCTTPTSAPPRDQRLSHGSRPAVSAAGIEKRIHALINRERQKSGLAPLEFDRALSVIARGHSRDMAARTYFSHVSPDGRDFSDRYETAHYRCSVKVGSTIYQGGENIALNNLYASSTIVNGIVSYDWNTEEEIARTTVQGWMDSTGHRRNILTPYFRREGIGVHVAPDDRVYVTQNFC